jgi:lysophospholipase L1-like esterase
VILWGPYLWTNGEAGRSLDGLKWSKEDCSDDGTHPSRSGQEKIARLLLDFFSKNPYAQPWFVQRP